MIQEIKQLELIKHGVSNFGTYWCYGTITFGNISYTGIINLDKNYELVDGSIYEVKNIKLTTRNGKLKITIAL